MAFLGGRCEPGSKLFGRYAGLHNHLNSADLVITAEGAIDRSSLMGKGVGEVARLCIAQGIPCVGLGGIVEDRARLKKHFTHVAALAPDLTHRQQAMAHPARWLAKLAEKVAGQLSAKVARSPKRHRQAPR
jgi:glycerate kinase